MVNNASILTAYQGLVGFRKSDNPDIVVIPSTNKLVDSESGLFVTSISGIDYNLIEAILGEDFASYITYLNNIYDETVKETIVKFWNDYKQKHGAKELIENRVLNQNIDCYSDKKLLDSFAYGFKLRPFKSNNIRLEATKFSIHSDTSATFVVYVYNTTQKAPITTKTVTVEARTAVSVDLTSAIVYCQNNGIGTGELMIIIYGYNSESIKVDKQLTGNFYGLSQPFKNESNYIQVDAVQFEKSAWNYNSLTDVYDLPDMSKMALTCETFGMNIRFNASCDYTQLLIDNRMLFAPIIQKAIALNLFMNGVLSTEFN